MNNQAELAVELKCTLGEGPVWHEESQSLYWVDILAFKLYKFSIETSRLEDYQMPSEIGCFAFGDDGLIYAALADGLYKFDEVSQELTFISRPSDLGPSQRFNDGKCDSSGRFYMGTMEKVDPQLTGSLYSVDASLTYTKHVDKAFKIPNGLSWNDDLQTFYHIDTTKGQINAYDCDLATGVIDHPRTVVYVDKSQGVPDGMTIDDQGMLWVCQWGGSKVCRYNPKTGEQVGEIKLPCLQPTSCCFGGPDMKDLYITTASVGDPHSRLAGSIFKVKLDVGGQVLPRFSTK